MLKTDFDIDLKFGEDGERWLTLLADEKTMEVKRDRLWHKTGNLFFEYQCNGNKSGLAITKADYFAVILSKRGANVATFIWRTDCLKSALRKILAEGKASKTELAGDGGRVSGLLVPLPMLGLIAMFCADFEPPTDNAST